MKNISNYQINKNQYQLLITIVSKKNCKILINISKSIATEILNFFNDQVRRTNNLIVFNLKEQDGNQKEKELVSD